MVRKILVLSLMAMSLAAPSLHAQTAPAAPAQPAANAVDPASIQALKDMGAFLQTLKRFHVPTEVTGVALDPWRSCFGCGRSRQCSAGSVARRARNELRGRDDGS